MEVALIKQRIHELRGQSVLLDVDLAELYGVETRVLNQAVKRNRSRFPADFMFQLTKEELENLKSQFVTSSWAALVRAVWLLRVLRLTLRPKLMNV